MNTIKKIEHYIGAFKKQTEVIEALKCETVPKLDLHKKILYVAVLDALSKSIYPKKGNRDRFTAFIQRFTEWKECERISLPHLNQLFTLVPDPEFEAVRRYSRTELAKWTGVSVVHLDQDPQMGEVQKHWPRAQEHRTPLAGIDLERLKHVNLLWFYRNSLVHEFRPLGFGIEFPDDTVPFYMTMDDMDSTGKLIPGGWELVYPVKFFADITSKSISNLETYLRDNGLNPISSYDVGSYWLQGLNVEDN